MDDPDADAPRPTREGDGTDAAAPMRGGIEAAGTALPALPPAHLLEAIARELAGPGHHVPRWTLVRLRFDPTVPVSRRRAVTEHIGQTIPVHDAVQRDKPVPVADLLLPDEYDTAPLTTALAGIAEVDGAVAMSSIPVRP